MYKIEANVEKNYLLIVLHGLVSGDELEKAIAQVHVETPQLSKGFTIINDISELKVLKLQDTEKVKEAQQWLYQQGAQKTIRIVKSAFAQSQFRKTQQAGKAMYVTIEVSNLQEAYQHL